MFYCHFLEILYLKAIIIVSIEMYLWFELDERHILGAEAVIAHPLSVYLLKIYILGHFIKISVLVVFHIHHKIFFQKTKYFSEGDGDLCEEVEGSLCQAGADAVEPEVAARLAQDGLVILVNLENICKCIKNIWEYCWLLVSPPSCRCRRGRWGARWGWWGWRSPAAQCTME